MCTVHLLHRVYTEAPVVVAANRDELLDRPWEEPRLLSKVPKVFGPRDSVSGGTWFGVNEGGLVAALTNHEGTLSASGGPCSRGFVVLEALRHGTAEEAVAFARAVAPVCKAYTLILADPKHAFVVDQAGGRCTVHPLAPGCHVVTNRRFDDPDDPKAARSQSRLAPLAARERLPEAADFLAFLSDHEEAGPGSWPLCIHPEPHERFGTSSASVVAVGSDGRTLYYAFAPGPPCVTPAKDVTPHFSERPARPGMKSGLTTGGAQW